MGTGASICKRIWTISDADEKDFAEVRLRGPGRPPQRLARPIQFMGEAASPGESAVRMAHQSSLFLSVPVQLFPAAREGLNGLQELRRDGQDALSPIFQLDSGLQ
jgi:hypothetical protein